MTNLSAIFHCPTERTIARGALHTQLVATTETAISTAMVAVASATKASDLAVSGNVNVNGSSLCWRGEPRTASKVPCTVTSIALAAPAAFAAAPALFAAARMSTPAGYRAASLFAGESGLEREMGSTRLNGQESKRDQHQDTGREAAGAGDPGS